MHEDHAQLVALFAKAPVNLAAAFWRDNNNFVLVGFPDAESQLKGRRDGLTPKRWFVRCRDIVKLKELSHGLWTYVFGHEGPYHRARLSPTKNQFFSVALVR